MTSSRLAEPPLAGGAELVAAIRADPLEALTREAAVHGDVFAYDGGDHRTIVLNRPAFARRVLVDRAVAYAKAGTPELAMLRPVLGEGLMTVEGPEWTAQRALAAPHFSEEALGGYAPLMAQEIDGALDAWDAEGASSRGLDVGEAMSALTLKIVARCLFGAALGADEADDVGAGVGALNEFMAAGPSGAAGADHAAQAGAMAKMAGIVWSVACAPQRVGGSRAALLAALLAREAREGRAGLSAVVEQVMTFLMAGHETTAKALTWTLWLLAGRPDLQDRLRAEAVGAPREPRRRAAGLAGAEAVLNEAMRLYPPVWLVSRKAAAEDEIGGFRIAEGTLVVISPYLLHRHPAIWSAPERFDPSRFAGGAAAALRDCRFMPFGAGARSCVGRRFATVEMALALAAIVERFALSRAQPDEIRPEALVTLRPAAPVRLRVIARRGAASAA